MFSASDWKAWGSSCRKETASTYYTSDLPSYGLPDRQRPVDEADAPMAEIDQMGDGGARARDVVAGDGGQARGDRRVIHENHSDSAPGQHREIVERTARGRHDDAAHVQAGQQAHELALAIGIGIGRAQHGDPVVLAQAVLNAAGGLGEEGVGDVVNEHPDQRRLEADTARAAASAAASLTAPETVMAMSWG